MHLCFETKRNMVKFTIDPVSIDEYNTTQERFKDSFGKVHEGYLIRTNNNNLISLYNVGNKIIVKLSYWSEDKNEFFGDTKAVCVNVDYSELETKLKIKITAKVIRPPHRSTAIKSYMVKKNDIFIFTLQQNLYAVMSITKVSINDIALFLKSCFPKNSSTLRFVK